MVKRIKIEKWNFLEIINKVKNEPFNINLKEIKKNIEKIRWFKKWVRKKKQCPKKNVKLKRNLYSSRKIKSETKAIDLFIYI